MSWRIVWRTHDETKFLSEMARKLDGAAKLEGWLAGAEKRVEWGEIDPHAAKAWARRLLLEMRRAIQ